MKKFDLKEKDRQSQLKMTFALMGILCSGDWLSYGEMSERLAKRGFVRCERTMRRMIRMLKEVGFNVICDKKQTPFRYKANKKKLFIIR